MTADLTIRDPYLYVGGKGASTPNPYYTFTQVFSPRYLRELFKWCEFLFYNSSQIYAVLRKFAEYPITDVTYDTTSHALKVKHQYLLEKVIRVRELLIKATLDKYVYGNAFISMYQPFLRHLECRKCGTLTNIKTLSYKFNLTKLNFTFECPSCKTRVTSSLDQVQDRKLMFSRKVNFIRWDPKLMDIDHNPMTGESVYYYTIPRDVMKKVQNGHKTLIDTLPLGFLKAIKENKQFQFAPGALFHMKTGGPAGINPQWGLPPLLSCLQMFHYTAVLRKANEAIALDHLVPFRIMHPVQGTSSVDPVAQINLKNWQVKLSQNLKMFRQDPLHIMFAPIPVGVTQIGGQGRALLTLGEIEAAEKNIIAALGIPMEFIYGGLTRSGMEATLRLIENQLQTHINDLKDLLQWVDDSCAKFLGWERTSVDMKPFRMIDDITQKSILMQIYLQGKQSGEELISDETIAELNDFDIKKEQDRIKQSKLDRLRRENEMRIEITKLQNNMATDIQMAAQQGGNMGAVNQQKYIAQADQLVQQLLQMDPNMRRSQLHALETEDYVMYSVVIQRLEQAQTSMKQQASSQMGM